ILREVQSLGLSPPQARVFVGLVQLGGGTASQLSRISRVHRVDIYRILKELTKMHIIEIAMGKPNRFLPVEPSVAFRYLLQQKTDNLLEMKNTAAVLVSELHLIRNSAGMIDNSEVTPSSYLVIQGRERGYVETRKMLEHASVEVLRIGTANSITRAVKSGLLKEYRRVATRDVKIRVLTRLNRDNLGDALRFATVAEIRHLKDEQLHLNMTIVDRNKVQLSASFDDQNLTINSPKDVYFLIADNNLAPAMAIFFENLWTNSLAFNEALSLCR
ncbi:MAG: hypothetical protein M1587_06225, partial [Thaumarchaeota archaeon]|nr:hypothetical protein [Nitrososphaerota archaeon]